MSRPGLRRSEGAKIAAILIAGSLALTSGRTPALAQSVEGYARAYVSIPLDGSADGPAFGLRLDLRNRDGAGRVDPGPRSNGPPPVLEVRLSSGEEPGELLVGGIAPAKTRNRADLDGAALWIWTGLGLAAAVAIVIAADAICIGINTSCAKDNDDKDDEDEGTDEPAPQ